MFGIDGSEFILILIVLIIIVEPKKLPLFLYNLGKIVARIRALFFVLRLHIEDITKAMEGETAENKAQKDKSALKHNLTALKEEAQNNQEQPPIIAQENINSSSPGAECPKKNS